jgi:hypothetical protein
MDRGFFQELQHINRDDEFRAKVLMNGIKKILEEKKASGKNQWYNRKPRATPKAW